ncbi:Utp8 family [Teratosphaeria destructans]|uniref:Utp8 family n=1 Tax=Teratosphaeria destructans TaxID=418781 RepID=A0A9W7SQG2_9PEZI|nr:Utp8 family [Teratosphaeria destructans]
MESLYSIAALPRPFDAEQGTVQAAPVLGIRNSKKRKRHEMAVGIDGEGVNIYNVQSQSQVTSYALPPQAYLCCPPCSVHVRPLRNASSYRQTYLILRDGPSDSKRRLLCLREEVDAVQRRSDPVSGVSKKERKLASGDILSVDVLPTRASPQVLLSYRDGRVECIADDLSGTIWGHTEADSEVEIEYAALTDVETAKKGLLAGREDVQAALEASAAAGASSNPSLLFHILRNRSRKSLRLYAVRGSSTDVVQSQKPGLRLVLEYDLPHTREYKRRKMAAYELHAATGKLYELQDGRLTAFDLTGVLPRRMTRIGGKGESITSFARISSSAVLAISSAKAVVYETKYGAAQASISLEDSTTAAVPGQKRKLIADGASAGPLQAVSFFSAIGTFVGLAGSELKGAQLSDELRSAKRNKTGSTLLVDVLGKGSASEKMKNERQAQLIAEWKSEVDAAVEANDLESLEVLSASALRLHTTSDLDEEEVEKAITASANNADGSEASAEDEHGMIARQLQDDSIMAVDEDNGSDGEWIATAETFDTMNIDRKRVYYLLSKLFHFDADPAASTRLRPTMEADNIFIWLAQTGFLTTSHIQRALALHASGPSDLQLQQGDVMAALGSMDNNFQLVHDLLALPIHWQLPDVARALEALVRSFDTPDEASALKSLPDSSAPQPKPHDDTSAPGAIDDRDVATEEAAAERELQITLNILSSGLEVRSAALRLVLTRLQTFPPKRITQALRSHLRPAETIFLMRVLRIELIDGGWTKQYLQESPPPADAPAPADSALASIALLLNCCIDAIGTSGWLIGQASDRLGAGDLLEGLKVEVSAALEGLYGLEILGNHLDEFARTARSLAGAEEGADERVERLRGARGGAVELDDAVMPVGGRFEVKSVGVGGKKKSRHEVLEERRSRVGRYCVERIRV